MGMESEKSQILDLIQTVRGDREGLIPGECMVATVDTKIVGCVRIRRLEDGTLKLASLGVYPEYRRYGIGLGIVKKLLETFLERPVYLMCFPQLEGFYRKNGFEMILGDDLPPILRIEYEKHAERTRQDVLCMVIR
jgi:N-acetylglutamate synthase-like GNAT family acetyltransferase